MIWEVAQCFQLPLYATRGSHHVIPTWLPTIVVTGSRGKPTSRSSKMTSSFFFGGEGGRAQKDGARRHPVDPFTCKQPREPPPTELGEGLFFVFLPLPFGSLFNLEAVNFNVSDRTSARDPSLSGGVNLWSSHAHMPGGGMFDVVMWFSNLSLRQYLDLGKRL